MKIKNHYSFFQKIKLAVWFIRTKLLCRKARLIRFPFDLRGGTYINLGKSLTTGRNCRIEAFAVDQQKPYKKLIFGEDVQINDYVHISAIEQVYIGNGVLIASHVYISDNSHGSYKGDENDSCPTIRPVDRPYFTSPVFIGDNTWIGEGVIVLPGAHIGKGCIVGAHSLVKEGIYPDGAMLAGIPARIVKKYNPVSRCWEKIQS